MSPLIIGIVSFVVVSGLVGSVAMLLRDKPGGHIEDRLDLLTGSNTPAAARDGLLKEGSVLAEPLDDTPTITEALLNRFGNITLLFEQADTSLTVSRLVGISAIMGLAGAGLGATARVHPALLPLVGIVMAGLPMLWLIMRRRKRLKQFAVQLPDALEMLARALRSGQSFAFGLNSIADEMGPPISKEFSRVFEEQNLGIPLEESLRDLTERVPNLDLQFFVTAVVLQRQTGGDLAEILDKIGHLIRERFQIWGQVQALTGEGRLSGIVLLALPVLLFIVVYQMNPDYISVLFTDPMGKKMLAGAIIMQVFGAIVIQKIINIKV